MIAATAAPQVGCARPCGTIACNINHLNATPLAPHASAPLLQEAAATQECRLEAVSSKALFGQGVANGTVVPLR